MNHDFGKCDHAIVMIEKRGQKRREGGKKKQKERGRQKERKRERERERKKENSKRTDHLGKSKMWTSLLLSLAYNNWKKKNKAKNVSELIGII